jgi:hypothetical protein
LTEGVIIAGCPENIGLVVEVIRRLGFHEDRDDAYYIRTVSGRKFDQLWMENDLQRGSSDKCDTDRHKLRPLVDPNDPMEDKVVEAPLPSQVTA